MWSPSWQGMSSHWLLQLHNCIEDNDHADDIDDDENDDESNDDDDEEEDAK